jgi:putative phosphoribosyl transferase
VAALLVAADRPGAVAAVVSRGGRPDLAGAVRGRVRAPTLLVVGGRDRTVLALNRAVLEGLAGRGRLEVMPGASHLFPEPSALERVAELAVARFLAHLAGQLTSEQATS